MKFRESITPAVDGVSFDLQPGEIVALLGESGAGKTTLGRALAALLPDSAQVSGVVHVIGLNTMTNRYKPAQHVSFIPQDLELALNPFMRIRDQIGEVIRARSPKEARQNEKTRTVELLELVGLPANLGVAYPHQLSGGQRQRAVIAQVLASRAPVLIADEPTSALDSVSQAEILGLFKRLVTDTGAGLLLITHDPTLLARFADRVLVMQGGRLVESGDSRSILCAPREPFTVRLMKSVLPLPIQASSRPAAGTPATILEARGISKIYGEHSLSLGTAKVTRAVSNVNLRLGTGRLISIVGTSGAGKSTLARCLALLEKPDAGETLYRGQPVSAQRGGEVRKRRRDIQMLWQHSALSLNPRFCAIDLVTEPLVANGFASRSRSVDQAREMMALMGLPQSMERRRPAEMSGGQRQRVAFARALILSPSVLILDEPFAGLDLPLQREMIELLLHLKRSFSLSCLFITHNLRSAAFISDQIAVMHNGSIVEIGEPGKVFCDPETAAARELASAVAAN